MSQEWNTLATTNQIKADVARHNQNYSSLRSNFSGTSFPSNPVEGQHCWRTDRGVDIEGGGKTGRLYKYCGNTSVGENGWVVEEETSLLSKEIENSRGSKLTLDQRLDIALNEDGTLKSSVEAYQSEWITPSLTFTYLTTTSFETDGNTTDIYLSGRRLKVNLTSSYDYTSVVSSSYDSGTDKTSVTVSDEILDGALVSVQHGIISTGESSSLPDDVVKTDGDQTIDGIKTFTSSPMVPTPLTGASAVNKDYVDNIISIDDTKPYGGNYSKDNDAFFRVGGETPFVQQEMKRVVCQGNPMWGGAVYKYLDKYDSTKFEDGTDASNFISGGDASGTSSTYQVLVEIPRFYYRTRDENEMQEYLIAKAPFSSSSTHPLFRKSGWSDQGDGTDSANEFDYAYVSAFENTLWDDSAGSFVDGNPEVAYDTANDKLLSVSTYHNGLNIRPVANITRGEARNLKENAGDRQTHWYARSALVLLYITEYLDWDSQTVIGRGHVDESSFSYAGTTPPGATCVLGNATGSVGGSTGTDSAMSYRGIENFYGNLYTWVDGVNIQDYVPYVCTIDATYADDTFTGDYVQVAGVVQPSTSNSYQKEIHPDSTFVKAVGGSSSTYMCDNYWAASGNRVVGSGGRSYGVSRAGFLALGFSDDPVNASAHVSAR